jgi:branched-chain amino acid transport system ATP-binding protein
MPAGRGHGDDGMPTAQLSMTPTSSTPPVGASMAGAAMPGAPMASVAQLPVAPVQLSIEGLVSGYGSTPVLHELNMAVLDGRVTVVLGANGVGKTTLLRAIGGLIGAWKGSIGIDGRPVHHLGPEARVRLGIGTVPEPPAIFRNLTVSDNLSVGALSLKTGRRRESELRKAVLDKFPLLARRASQIAGSLSGGEQRMLAIARALMGEPRLLLVDEASMGLSPAMVDYVLAMLKDLRDGGLTVLMAEQDLAALEIADRAYVLERGRVVREAEGEALSTLREEASRVYLGAATSEGRQQ